MRARTYDLEKATAMASVMRCRLPVLPKSIETNFLHAIAMTVAQLHQLAEGVRRPHHTARFCIQ